MSTAAHSLQPLEPPEEMGLPEAPGCKAELQLLLDLLARHQGLLREDAVLGATGILLSQQNKWQLLTGTARAAVDEALAGDMWGWWPHCDPGMEEVCSQS